MKKGLDLLWNRFCALETYTIAGLLFHKSVINTLRRELRRKFKSKFAEDEIKEALTSVICQTVTMDKVRMTSIKKARAKRKIITTAHPVVIHPVVETPAISDAQNN